LSTTTAHSAPLTYFGEDLGQGESVRLPSHPNSDAARALFLSGLVGVGTENLESYATNTPAPLNITFPGAGTATLNGNGLISTVVSGTNGVGRYPVSGNNFWEASDVFSISFTSPVAAFGFYGIDIGDFAGQVTLTLTSGSEVVVPIPHTVSGLGGSVIYFGVIDTVSPFIKVTFGNTAPGTDFFGFDDFTIGSRAQVVAAQTTSWGHIKKLYR
jgi:hypothetical protein